MDRRQVLGVFGSILLFIGVFTPMVKIPIVGIKSFFDNSHSWGAILIVLAFAALMLALIKKYRLIWLPGIASIGAIVYSFIQSQNKARALPEKILGERLTDKIVDKAAKYVHIQWGVVFLILGIILIIAAAAMPGTKKEFDEGTGVSNTKDTNNL